MKKILLIAICSLFTAQLALAADANSCEAKATEKNLKGAAKTSFMKKCEKDSAAPAAAKPANDCAAKAEEKKLKGAAKNSFMKKCEKDAAATPAAMPAAPEMKK
jgi:hypothetical protein